MSLKISISTKKFTVNINNIIVLFQGMAKIGYSPKWGDIHTKTMKDFREKKGEQGVHSPKFNDVNKALNWLNS